MTYGLAFSTGDSCAYSTVLALTLLQESVKTVRYRDHKVWMAEMSQRYRWIEHVVIWQRRLSVCLPVLDAGVIPVLLYGLSYT